MTISSTFDPFSYNRAIRDSELPSMARHVAMTLATYANRTGEAWPSQTTLSRGSGWARRSVNNALNALAEGGWLTRVQKGHEGRATLYRLHLPGAAAQSVNTPGPVCTPGHVTVQLGTPQEVATCTPRPSGEQHIEDPWGGVLARPDNVPDELWQEAEPLLRQLLDELPPVDAGRFCNAWPLEKARDFCWLLTELSGRNAQARPRPGMVRTPAELISALTAVPLDDVLHVGPVMYKRLVRLADGLPAVPPPEDPRLRVREAWAVPPGAVGDAVVRLARTLSKDTVEPGVEPLGQAPSGAPESHPDGRTA